MPDPPFPECQLNTDKKLVPLKYCDIRLFDQHQDLKVPNPKKVPSVDHVNDSLSEDSSLEAIEDNLSDSDLASPEPSAESDFDYPTDKGCGRSWKRRQCSRSPKLPTFHGNKEKWISFVHGFHDIAKQCRWNSAKKT